MTNGATEGRPPRGERPCRYLIPTYGLLVGDVALVDLAIGGVPAFAEIARLAAPPYDALSPAELDELVTELEPITATLVAAGSK